MKNKKAIKTVLIIVCVIAAVLALIGVWQRENIKSIVNSFRYSEEQITEKLTDNDAKLQDIIDNTDYIEVRGGLTEEEESALASGKISADDAVRLVRGQVTLDELNAEKEAKSSQTTDGSGQIKDNTAPAAAEKPDTDVKDTPEAPETGKDDVMKDKVSDIVAQLYVVKSDFISQLEATGQSAYNEYVASGGGKAELAALSDTYLSKAGALEAQCDAKVNELLKQLQSALREGGGDMSLVKEVKQYYYNEKSLKKSYYLNKYMNNSD